jgi:hypothetical protein
LQPIFSVFSINTTTDLYQVATIYLQILQKTGSSGDKGEKRGGD